jgi:hypothetical protein
MEGRGLLFSFWGTTWGPQIFLVLLTASWLFVSHTGRAQPIRYGVKGGLSASTIASDFPGRDIDLDPERRRGISLFLLGEWRVTSLFSFMGEVRYAQRGYRTVIKRCNEEGIRIGERTQTTSFGYAATTVLGKARYPALFSPYLLAGPHLGALLHSSFDAPNTDRTETTVTRQYDTVTVGGTVGIGVETKRLLPATTSFVEVRFGADLTDSLSDAPREIRNRTLEVLMGLTF